VTRKLFKTVIVGAGPAGLTAAYQLAKEGVPVVVLENDPDYVGGISRTVNYKGFRFDIGGHRFFSKSRDVEDLWTEIAGDLMLERPRSSSIYYRGQFFAYPLKPFEALSKLGFFESILCVLSFVKARLRPTPNPKSFEDWVVNQFGERLFRIFFKTYTEKVWGMSCQEISADWAAQRIKGLSLASAIKHALLPKRKTRNRKDIVKTLIDTFRYPRKGPGMMWEACAGKIRQMGGEINLGRSVVGCRFDSLSKSWIVTARTAAGEEEEYRGEHLISSMPMRQLVAQIQPPLPDAAVTAAQSLRYRDFLTVGLILREQERVADNWIYIHDPGVKVGRVQNYKSWSPEMVPDPSYCCYGLEYFCFEGDGLWSAPDSELIALAKKEIEHVNLGLEADVLDGCVIRQPKAYPVYDDAYLQHVATIRQALEEHCPNLHLVGRNGMHKYNNQDHAMMTAMLTAKNIMAGGRKFDVWAVNQDAEYHEAGEAGEQTVSEFAASSRLSVPTPVAEQ
jgi:protoporphyrinogen oxidase